MIITKSNSCENPTDHLLKTRRNTDIDPTLGQKEQLSTTVNLWKPLWSIEIGSGIRSLLCHKSVREHRGGIAVAHCAQKCGLYLRSLSNASANGTSSRVRFIGKSSCGLRRLSLRVRLGQGDAFGLEQRFRFALPGFRLIRPHPILAAVMPGLVPEGQLQLGAGLGDPCTSKFLPCISLCTPPSSFPSTNSTGG